MLFANFSGLKVIIFNLCIWYSVTSNMMTLKKSGFLKMKLYLEKISASHRCMKVVASILCCINYI